jgi:hypothetical protein
MKSVNVHRLETFIEFRIQTLDDQISELSKRGEDPTQTGRACLAQSKEKLKELALMEIMLANIYEYLYVDNS